MSTAEMVVVVLGAGLGAMVRHVAVAGRGHDALTLVNFGGSFVLGALVAGGASSTGVVFLGAGVAGGLTTWSGLAVAIVDIGETEGPSAAGRWAVTSVAIGLLGAMAGWGTGAVVS